MNELALFAGAGGGILGGHLLGWRCVCAVEYDKYARNVLLSRQRDGHLPKFPIWDDVRTFDGKPWRGVVDVVSGGFPCQDISSAGKGAGIEGARSGLWKEMARIIGEVRPRFAFVENSPLLIRRGLTTVLGDLTEMGYDAVWGIVSAADCGAPHLRKRIWIVAWDTDPRCQHESRSEERPDAKEASKRGTSTNDVERLGEDVGDTDNDGCATTKIHEGIRERSDGVSKGEVEASQFARSSKQHAELANAMRKGLEGQRQESCGARTQQSNAGNSSWWETEPDVGRVAHGVASRVDRLRCIGNGQVPIVAATAWRELIGLIERQ